MENPEKTIEKQANPAPQVSLYSEIDMRSFLPSKDTPVTSPSVLPPLELAGLLEDCQALGSDAGACVKSVRRHGLA